jgi:hypothetical protein
MSESRSDGRKPWLKFFTTDWRADPALRGCSFAARGLWIDLLTLMHEAESYGELKVAGGIPSEKRLAALLGSNEKTVRTLLAELEVAHVFSRREDGTIYSRRMVRDFDKLLTDKANGGKGGNPRLVGKDKPTPTPPDKGRDNPRVNREPTAGLTEGVNLNGDHQRPEARQQASKLLFPIRARLFRSRHGLRPLVIGPPIRCAPASQT